MGGEECVAGAFAGVLAGPPEVLPGRDGNVRYPGVILRSHAADPVRPLTVRVHLPAGKGLEWGTAGQDRSGYQLTVLDGGVYSGALSSDGLSLVFTDVDPGPAGPGSECRMRIESRGDDELLARTPLTFTVEGEGVPSASVVVDPRTE